MILSAGQTWKASIITAELKTETETKTGDAKGTADTVAAADTANGQRMRPTDAATAQRTPDIATRTPDAKAPDIATRTPDAKAPDIATRTPDAKAPDIATRTPDAKTPDPKAPDTKTPDTKAPDTTDNLAREPLPERKPDKRGTTEIERRFKAGWSLLRAGKAREAARELGAAADLAPNDPLAADARYFQAIAYVRAGERLEAERILVRSSTARRRRCAGGAPRSCSGA